MVRRRRTAARFAAPVAFLAAATVAVLLVRGGLEADDAAAPATTAAQTQPAATTTAAATTAPARTTTGAATTTGTAGAEFYEIQTGDTLETIAADHGTTVEQLLVLNPDVDPVALTIGARIRVR
ncbi:MAG TPA: LysM domain-containing protein [Gaiellaceae bacterium]|nr:LysM domain-containing protein [Gaiellaceae bacterium]